MPVRPIWSQNCLNFLFELVIKKFGPYSEWKCETVPGDDTTEEGHRKNVEYALFCDDFAKLVGAESLDAVGMKITRFSMIPTIHGHASHAMACSAALNTGFIIQSVIGRNNPYGRPTPYGQSLRPLLPPRPRHQFFENEVVISVPAESVL